ncbi:hypothetical protein [Methylophilus sp. QUAN]|uniref:hypothetical protein n=1 Tax=Methylophilus sp. QUAN TaxID=2781020 RepID=UPI001890AB24|nr:hypothetical protein [Methylophilus sp. QUAN]MBF4991059.1 hypothetical protein [Methylophilus sp. QUAN]
MKNLPFVLWMLLFPLVISIGSYFDFLSNGSVISHASEKAELTNGLFIFVVWIFVGYLTYEGRAAHNKPEKSQHAASGTTDSAIS